MDYVEIRKEVDFVSAYRPESEKKKGRNKIWDDLTESLEEFRKNDKTVLHGDLNAMVGNLPVEGVVGLFEVLGVSETEEGKSKVVC